MLGAQTIASSLRRAALWFGGTEPATPAYDAAGHSRRTAGWRPTSGSINAILYQSAETLRARSRDMARKNPWAISGINKYASNAIGTGIKPQSGHPDKDVRKSIQDLWNDWTDESDAHGVTDFYGQQKIAVTSIKEAGEIFARLRPRLASDGLTVPLQVQLIAPEHVPVSMNQTLTGGNVIRQGIEFDGLGRRAAYHMYREYPGDMTTIGNINEMVRVPASEVVHVFDPIQPGQIRGIPGLAAVLLRLYEFDQYEDGELVRNRDAAMFSGFIRDDVQSIAAIADGVSDGDKLMASIAGIDGTTGDAIDLVKLEPGTFQKLRLGEEVELATPGGMAEGYADFMRWVLRAIAAGLGVTYEQLTGDLSGVNYSSIRAGMMEFRRAMEQFQHSVFVFQFCRPVWGRWMDQAVLSGALAVGALEYRRNLRLWRKVKWVPQGWGWVDPVKEVAAAKDAIRAGLSSRSQEVSATGYDAEDIDAENAEDNARADDLGVAYDSDGRRPATGNYTSPDPLLAPGTDGGGDPAADEPAVVGKKGKAA